MCVYVYVYVCVCICVCVCIVYTPCGKMFTIVMMLVA